MSVVTFGNSLFVASGTATAAGNNLLMKRSP
jgi:hypothetical protein